MSEIDVRKLVEMLDDKARLELCKYAFDRLTVESQAKLLQMILGAS